jgi:hypothetical protein
MTIAPFARARSVEIQPADLLAPTIKHYNQRGIKVELELNLIGHAVDPG